MSQETFLRIFFSLILGLCFAWNIFSQYDEDVGSERTGDDGRRYRPYLPGCLLYLFFFLIVASSAFFYGPQKMPEATLSICFGIFFQICLYYAVLMPLLPFFRRRISARACATLWLLPNFLYITSLQFMEPNRPLLVFHAPIRLIWALFGIWLAGFLAVFLYHIISHLVFRARILRDAVPVTDPVTLNVWEQELTFLNIRKPKFQLLRSPTVSTPLSVGLYERTTRVVLPDRSYSREELSLILRHELIHISRGDPFAKLFMALCTASCWFNPPMWGAMRRCADDLELSCDETVLLNADGDTRQQYASLLLQTAGDERGFTTCLSASASALRYRLKHVVEPRKVGSGALAVGLIFFLLCITCGYVSLAYDSARGADLIFQGRDLSAYTLKHARSYGEEFDTTYTCTDPDALLTYLAELPMETITGSYSFSDPERELTLIFSAPEGTLGVTLSDHSIRLTPLYGDRGSSTYYLPTGADWDHLDSLLLPFPALHIRLKGPDDIYGTTFSASLISLTLTEGKTVTVLQEPPDPREAVSGSFGHYASEPCTVALTFSLPPLPGGTLEIESWDGSSSRTLSLSELEDPICFTTAAAPAHYNIHASFAGPGDAIYDAVFRFDIGDMDN